MRSVYRLGTRIGARKVSRSLSTLPTRPIQFFQFDTLVELQQKATAAYATNPMFGTKVGSAFEWTTYSEFDVEVSKCRIALAEHHLGKNDKLAIISNNRLEWAVIKYAANGLGAQVIPMYEAQMEKDWTYILEDSDAKVLVVATEAIYEKVKNYPGKVGKVERIICLDAPVDKPYSYKHWMQKAVTMHDVPARTDVTADDIATIIYTSGTTGKPKGVELSHRNLCGVVHGTNELYRKYDEAYLTQQVSLAYLPWAHVYGMTCEVHQLTSTGSARAIVPNREQMYERSDAMLAVYPGEGARFAKHIDNSTGDGRRLTLLVYLNPGWKKEDGGALRLFPGDYQSSKTGSEGTADASTTAAATTAAAHASQEAVDVYPEGGRLAMFYSADVPHEVLPTFADRHAITLWYYDQSERAQAVLKAKEGGTASKVATASTQSQQLAKVFIGELMGGDEVAEDGGEPTEGELRALASKVTQFSDEVIGVVAAITGAPSVQSFRTGFPLLSTQDLKAMRALFRRMGLGSYSVA